MTKKPIKKSKKKIEHCDNPKCPECNMKVYKKGREYGIKQGHKDGVIYEHNRIIDKLIEYNSKGYELKSAIESIQAEYVANGLSRHKASLERKKRILLADGIELEQEVLKNIDILNKQASDLHNGIYSPEKETPKKSIISRIKWMLQQLRP